MGWLKGIIGGPGTLRRQYSLSTLVFALLILGIIFLFGHLISQSLSRRYLEDVLISGREDALKIADDLAPGEIEELQVVGKRREALYRTLEGVAQRRIIENAQVLDKDGNVVFSFDFRSTERIPEEASALLEMGGAFSDQNVKETEDSYQIAVPIGEVGEVVLNVSKGRLYERVVRLRRELLWQTVTVAVLTLATLVVAFVIVWFLIQRTRRLERKHREAEELAALGGLAANLAHEIRNPLNSINLNLELLEEDLEDGGAEAVASLAGTRQEVARLARLVSDFLTYARPTEPILEEVATAKVLREVHEFLGAEARASGVHLRLGRDPFEGTVLSDPGQLRQVLLNLVLNAIQAVVGLQADRRLVELVTAVDGNEVKLIVRDRGDGIPDAELPRVRRAFYTRRRGGTGLGLAIAERYVEAHSGRIELENLAGGGFEARVVLPIHRGDGKMSAASAH